MKRFLQFLTKLSILVLSLALISCGSTEKTTVDLTKLPENIGQTADGELRNNLEAIRQAYGLPAIAGMIIEGNEVLEMGVTGYRTSEQIDEVTMVDRWHIGSLTKSMTATLAARLVEQNLISFQSTVSEIFPELVDQINPVYEDVTLAELLSSTSGLMRNLPSAYDEKWKNRSDSLIEQRYLWTEEMLNTPPAIERGKHLYSNGGYIIAGHMLERASGIDWETLITAEIFSPLHMDNVGFGPPNFDDSTEQISGHYLNDNVWRARQPSDGVFIPFVMGPAGTVNADLQSLSHYLKAQLSGAQGSDNIITAQSYKKLHTEVSENYALGWGSFDVSWSTGKVLSHSGSNSFWLTEWIVVPEENFAVMVAFNAAGGNVTQAQEKVMRMLIDRYSAYLTNGL